MNMKRRNMRLKSDLIDEFIEYAQSIGKCSTRNVLVRHLNGRSDFYKQFLACRRELNNATEEEAS